MQNNYSSWKCHHSEAALCLKRFNRCQIHCRIIARYSISPSLGDVTSMDVCSKKNFVAIGTKTGHVTIIQVNTDGFKVSKLDYISNYACAVSTFYQLMK